MKAALRDLSIEIENCELTALRLLMAEIHVVSLQTTSSRTKEIANLAFSCVLFHMAIWFSSDPMIKMSLPL